MARPEPTTYRTVEDVDQYFANQLYSTDWSGSSASDKLAAIQEATRTIDRLKFAGVKAPVYELLAADSLATEAEQCAAAATQTRQFPRDDADDPESWKITVSATGGTYTLTLNAEETGNIAFDATAATITTALEALASMSSGDVTVTVSVGGTDGVGPYDIAMAGTLATQRYNTLTSDPALLTGGDQTATVSVINDNIPDAIFYAMCEEAMSLLSGRLASQEFRNLVLTSDGVGTSRHTSDRSQMPPLHTSHFFTSPEAWLYVQQLLANNNTFNIKRV